MEKGDKVYNRCMNLFHNVKTIIGFTDKSDIIHIFQAGLEACVARSKDEIEGCFLVDGDGEELLAGHTGWRPKLPCKHAEYQTLATAMEKYPKKINGSVLYVSKLLKRDDTEIGKAASKCELCRDLALKAGVARVVHVDPNSKKIISDKVSQYFKQNIQ